MMRILHIMASHRWTGAAEPAARAAAGQVRAGHEVLFALTAGASFDEHARALGVPTTDRVPFERSYLPHRKLRDLRRLRALVASFRPDIVHAHLTHDHTLAALALGARGAAGRPLLVRTFHREEKLRSDPLTRALRVGRTDGFVTISGSMARQLRATYGLDAARIACIGGGVDGERFAPSDRGALLRARWGIAPDAPVAGIVSRLRPARGHLWLLDAAARVLPARPAARLVVCGRGSWKDELAAHVARHPARDQIVLAGYVTGTDLEDSYNAFDVALLLKPGNDGACRAALEAMACGRPLIGGDLGALHDLLAGTEAGWLVPPDDVEALAAALGQALDDPTGCRTRGARARQHIERHFTEEAMTAQLLAFYAALPGAHDSGKHASPR